MEVTVSACEVQQEITLPMAGKNKDGYEVTMTEKPELGSYGMKINDCVLQNCLSKHSETEIWLASDKFNESVVVKLSSQCGHMELLKEISRLECPALVPIYSMGECEAGYYEIMPYYRHGYVKEKLSEEEIRNYVLPALIDALHALHTHDIVHNDIKPENLFWDDEKRTVLLGDYGCVSKKGEKPDGYSLAYVAPDILRGQPARPSTDWMSVGVLLGTLLTGEKMITQKTVSAVLRWWEKSIYFDKGTEGFNRLVNGFLEKNVKKRLGPKAAENWIRHQAVTTDRLKRRTETETWQNCLVFENPRFVVKNVDELLLAIEHYWEHCKFLFEQHKIENFLRGIEKNHAEYCITLRRKKDTEKALFYLSFYLSHGRFFVWQGKKFTDLSQFESVWQQNPEMVSEFLRKGLVTVVLEKEDASDDVLQYVEELSQLCKTDAEKACNLLFIAAQEEENFTWKENTYASIEELARWLCSVPEKAEKEIHELLTDDRFRAWMAFQGYGDFVENIRRKSQNE